MERESLPKFRSRISKLHYENFIQTFSECKENFCIDFATFQSKYPDLQAKFVKWNSRKINERAIYVSTFELEKWKKFPSTKEAEHNLVECHRCSLTYSYQQSLFPVKSIQFKKSQKENNFPYSLNVQIWLECPTSTSNLHSAALIGGGIGQKRDNGLMKKLHNIYYWGNVKTRTPSPQTTFVDLVHGLQSWTTLVDHFCGPLVKHQILPTISRAVIEDSEFRNIELFVSDYLLQ